MGKGRYGKYELARVIAPPFGEWRTIGFFPTAKEAEKFWKERGFKGDFGIIKHKDKAYFDGKRHKEDKYM